MGFHVPGLKVAVLDGQKSFAEALGDGVKRCDGGMARTRAFMGKAICS